MVPVRSYISSHTQDFLCRGDHDIGEYRRVKVTPDEFSHGFKWLIDTLDYEDWTLLDCKIWFTFPEDATLFAMICQN